MGYGSDDMTAHGFRAMAAERLGIAPEVIEAQLAHSVRDALGRAYSRTQFLEQRRELMTLDATAFAGQESVNSLSTATFGITRRCGTRGSRMDRRSR